MEKVIAYFWKYSEKLLMWLFIFVVVFGLDVFGNFLEEPIKYLVEHGSVKGLMLFIFSIILLLTQLLIEKNKSNVEKVSDINRISDVKRKFLDDILNELKLSVDPKLKKQLENGEIDEANESIVEKIDALNKLIETVNGDNTKSLRGTEISSVSEFYESTSLRIKREIERIRSNASVHMILGVATSIIAIGILSVSVINHLIKLEELIPRISLSILIEALAFFFFNQYKKQQENIKFWNNEKTNLDLKIFGLSIAIDESEIGTPDYMRQIISELFKSEVNPNVPLKVEDKSLKDDEKTTDYKSLYNDLISKLKDLKSLT